MDRENEPFLIHGDSAWSLLTAITADEVELYLANRAAKGFNSLIANLIEHKFNGPQTREGDLPFKDLRDFSTPNESYFDYAAWVVERAAAHGMVIFLAPLFLGYRNPQNDEGWFQELKRNGPEKLFQYGQYIGQRFAKSDNIVWLIGCDRNTRGIEQEIYSLVIGIKAGGTQHLFTAQPAPEESTPEWYGGPDKGGWLDLNTTYTYGIVHKRLLADYNRKPAQPFVLIESSYEGEHNASAQQIRRQAFWSILCGACGQFFGNNPIWLFNPGWKEALNLEGSSSMQHVKALFTSRPWYELIPDQTQTVVTAGLGELNGLDYLAAARTADGSTVIAYLPTPRKINVEMSRLSGSEACAWWFDPRQGTAQQAGRYLTHGMRDFTTPGDGDWVLVLDDESRQYPPPGSQTG